MHVMCGGQDCVHVMEEVVKQSGEEVEEKVRNSCLIAFD